jgi:MoxR-like ATPase
VIIPRETFQQASATMRKVLYEIKRVIVGQDLMLERVLVALLARGHVLIEGVPGLAKTLAIKSTAKAIDCDFKRIQFTPDLVPADLVGTRIFNQRTSAFDIELGPLFANFVLADEINRAPAKVQSALLEAMQERQVTIGKQTFHLPEPFLVMATQNPIESEGTYPLPEAQVDRFMFKIVIGYPSYHEEVTVVERMSATVPEVGKMMSADQLKELQTVSDAVYVDPKILEYSVSLTAATREPKAVGLERLQRYIAYGASPRASLNMVIGGRALALLRGRDHVMPEDVRDVAPEVLRHRMVLSYEALADEISPDTILEQTIGAVQAPRIALGDPYERARTGGAAVAAETTSGG